MTETVCSILHSFELPNHANSAQVVMEVLRVGNYMFDTLLPTFISVRKLVTLFLNQHFHTLKLLIV